MKFALTLVALAFVQVQVFVSASSNIENIGDKTIIEDALSSSSLRNVLRAKKSANDAYNLGHFHGGAVPVPEYGNSGYGQQRPSCGHKPQQYASYREAEASQEFDLGYANPAPAAALPPCPQNYLISCQPNVNPVPCVNSAPQQSAYAPAPAPAPAPAYAPAPAPAPAPAYAPAPAPAPAPAYAPAPAPAPAPAYAPAPAPAPAPAYAPASAPRPAYAPAPIVQPSYGPPAAPASQYRAADNDNKKQATDKQEVEEAESPEQSAMANDDDDNDVERKKSKKFYKKKF